MSKRYVGVYDINDATDGESFDNVNDAIDFVKEILFYWIVAWSDENNPGNIPPMKWSTDMVESWDDMIMNSDVWVRDTETNEDVWTIDYPDMKELGWGLYGWLLDNYWKVEEEAK